LIEKISLSYFSLNGLNEQVFNQSNNFSNKNLAQQRKNRQWKVLILAMFFCGYNQTIRGALAGPEEARASQIRSLINKGNLLNSRKQFQQAIDTYRAVLELEPNNPYALANINLAHNNWGIYYFTKGEYDKAKAEWDNALIANPDDRNARNNLAVLNKTLAKLGTSLKEPSKQQGVTHAAAEQKNESTASESPPSAILLSPPAKSATANKIETYKSEDLNRLDSPAANSPANDAVVETAQGGDSAKTDSNKDPDKQRREGTKSATKENIELSLDALEMKIYGKLTATDSVVKRLEKIELDSFGKPCSGAIMERLSRLKLLYETN
jgi:tetratricopeptide (TPR) repeat protein